MGKKVEKKKSYFITWASFGVLIIFSEKRSDIYQLILKKKSAIHVQPVSAYGIETKTLTNKSKNCSKRHGPHKYKATKKT